MRRSDRACAMANSTKSGLAALTDLVSPGRWEAGESMCLDVSASSHFAVWSQPGGCPRRRVSAWPRQERGRVRAGLGSARDLEWFSCRAGVSRRGLPGRDAGALIWSWRRRDGWWRAAVRLALGVYLIVLIDVLSSVPAASLALPWLGPVRWPSSAPSLGRSSCPATNRGRDWSSAPTGRSWAPDRQYRRVRAARHWLGACGRAIRSSASSDCDRAGGFGRRGAQPARLVVADGLPSRTASPMSTTSS